MSLDKTGDKLLLVQVMSWRAKQPTISHIYVAIERHQATTD